MSLDGHVTYVPDRHRHSSGSITRLKSNNPTADKKRKKEKKRLTINGEFVRWGLPVSGSDKFEIVRENLEPQFDLLHALVLFPKPATGFFFTVARTYVCIYVCIRFWDWFRDLPVGKAGKGESTAGVADELDEPRLEVVRYQSDWVWVIEGWSCGSAA